MSYPTASSRFVKQTVEPPSVVQLNAHLAKASTLSLTHLKQALHYAQRALKGAKVLLSQTPPHPQKAIVHLIELKSLLRLGDCHTLLSKLDKAQVELEEAVRLAKKLHRLADEALAHLRLSKVFRARNEFKLAFRHAQIALNLYRQTDERDSEARALNVLGILMSDLGDYTAAVSFYQEALERLDLSEDKATFAAILINLSNAFHALHDYEKALAYGEKSQALKEELGDRHGAMMNLTNLSMFYFSVGEQSENADLIAKGILLQKESLAYKQEIGNLEGTALSLTNLAMMHDSLGELGKANDALDEALALNRQMNHRLGIVRCLYHLADLRLKEKRIDEALALLNESLVLAENINAHLRFEKSNVHQSFAKLYEAQGRYDLSLYHYKEHYKLERDIISAEALNKIQAVQTMFDIERMKEEQTHLKRVLALKQKQLQSSALAITNKTESLRSIRARVAEIVRVSGRKKKDALAKALLSAIDDAISAEKNLKSLERELREIDTAYLESLAKRFPDLSAQELKICAMLKYNIPTKQIATLLSISLRTVEKHRQNIRQTLLLEHDQNLSVFLNSISSNMGERY